MASSLLRVLCESRGVKFFWVEVAERSRKNVQNVDEMLQLSRGRLRIFASGTHIDDGPAINIEARQNTATQINLISTTMVPPPTFF